MTFVGVKVLTIGFMHMMDSLNTFNVQQQHWVSVLTDASITGSSSMSATLPAAPVAAITINLSFSSDYLPGWGGKPLTLTTACFSLHMLIWQKTQLCHQPRGTCFLMPNQPGWSWLLHRWRACWGCAVIGWNLCFDISFIGGDSLSIHLPATSTLCFFLCCSISDWVIVRFLVLFV